MSSGGRIGHRGTERTGESGLQRTEDREHQILQKNGDSCEMEMYRAVMDSCRIMVLTEIEFMRIMSF